MGWDRGEKKKYGSKEYNKMRPKNKQEGYIACTGTYLFLCESIRFKS